MKIRSQLLPVFAIFILFGSSTTCLRSGIAQDGVAAANLETAKEISAASGRPIFAIAGRST